MQVGQNLDDSALLQQVDKLVEYVPHVVNHMKHSKQPYSDLRYIEKHIKKAIRRSGVKKVFSHQLDQLIVRLCQERLTHAMILFGVSDLLAIMFHGIISKLFTLASIR